MPISRLELQTYLNNLLQPERIRDYCPNGLQVEGKSSIEHIVTGVTASQALIDAAIEQGADAILVHHGYFWKGEDARVVGMKRKRLAALLTHDINLFAYHLPLDIHPTLGNNAQLASRLGIETLRGLDANDQNSVAMLGTYEQAKSIKQITNDIETQLARTPLVEQVSEAPIQTVAWCTGGGQGYIEMAAEQGVDLFITGEVSEKTIHTAREMNINFIAAGHHATERYGVKAVGEKLADDFSLKVTFIDIDNPA